MMVPHTDRHRHGGESPRAGSSHYYGSSRAGREKEKRGIDYGGRERRGRYKDKYRSRRCGFFRASCRGLRGLCLLPLTRRSSSHSSFEDDFGVRKETMLHGSYEEYLKEYNTSRTRTSQVPVIFSSE